MRRDLTLASGGPLSPSISTFHLANANVRQGTKYYWQVVKWKSSSCLKESAIPSVVTSCNNATYSTTMTQGSTMTAYNPGFSDRPGFDLVDFYLPSPSNISVNPPSDTDYPYTTNITANTVGVTTLQSRMYLVDGTLGCTRRLNVSVETDPAWWQVRDSDVWSKGSIVSNIFPINVYFNVNGAAGFPGIPVYEDSTNLTYNVSEAPFGWIAQAPWFAGSLEKYNSTWFADQIPPEITSIISPVNGTNVVYKLNNGIGTADANGYRWYRYDGSTGNTLVIPAGASLDLAAKKVVLLVTGYDLEIGRNINLDNGSGFFMAVVGKDATGTTGGNILINPVLGNAAPVSLPNAAHLEGIYVADGAVSTGTKYSPPTYDNQLYIRGSVVGFEGINLQRNMGGINNQSFAAEFFLYAADQVHLIPKPLKTRLIKWKEVAP